MDSFYIPSRLAFQKSEFLTSGLNRTVAALVTTSSYLSVFFPVESPTFQLAARQQDVDGVIPSPCGFGLDQTGAAN